MKHYNESYVSRNRKESIRVQQLLISLNIPYCVKGATIEFNRDEKAQIDITECMETFYIINRKQQPLSQFAVNDRATKNQLKFRRKDCISFPTEKEASLFLQTIVRTCKQRLSASRLAVSNACNW